jgi:hypothetical protein
MRRRVDISLDHIVPAARLPERHVPQLEMPGGRQRRQHGRDHRRHDQRQHHDQLAVDRLGDRADEGAEQQLRQLARRDDAVTASAEPVTSKANSADASSSSQRMALANAPTSHSRRKSGWCSSSRTAGRSSG